MVEMIISPATILASSNVFYKWTQDGCKDPTVPGRIRFTSKDGLLSMFFDLEYHDGLYYCSMDVFAIDHDNPVRVYCRRTNAPPSADVKHIPSKFAPTSNAHQVESEVWLLCLGSPGKGHLDILPGNITGTPAVSEYHLFQSIDFKEQAYIWKQAAQCIAERIPTCRAEFFMDFAFMQASTDDYKRPNKSTDCIITSYNGQAAHLFIVDSASCRVWVFLTKSKEPLLDILKVFMAKFGLGMGDIRTDQGGELAWSAFFWEMMLKDLGYVVKPTGADSPSQNGGAEIYNNTLAVKVRTLLYGAGLSKKFWSAALLHTVYLHNQLVHLEMHKTPYKGWYGCKPDIAHLKTFGSWICVKCTGSRRCKLDLQDFTGIFLG
jgi:hypothetical protein